MQQAGHPLTDDVNGYRQEGFAAFDRTIHRGRRLSAARAYLHPVRGRKNLKVRTRAFVEKVLFDGTRATGVLCDGERIEAGDVILCGGAINTPQLLQLSGVGPRALLEPLGVEVVHDLPGVGENLQDHLEVYVQHACTEPVSQQPSLALWRRPFIGANWLFLRGGPGATNHFEAGGLHPLRRRGGLPQPDVPLPAHRRALRRHGPGRRARLPGAHRADVLRRPRLRPHHLHRPPRHKPALRFNYLSTEQDRREWVEAIRHARKILSQPAWADLDGGEISPARGCRPTRRSWPGSPRTARRPCTRRAPARWAPTSSRSWTPRPCACTASTGCAWWTPRPCRTSPTATSTPPVMMLAEKAADLILGNTPLPPEPVEFYRAR
ncbi:hypothetical protein GCM10020001_067260 [Nonomuraea salmonea]